MFVMKIVEETFRQLLQMVWCLWLKRVFVYIDEDFEIYYYVNDNMNKYV